MLVELPIIPNTLSQSNMASWKIFKLNCVLMGTSSIHSRCPASHVWFNFIPQNHYNWWDQRLFATTIISTFGVLNTSMIPLKMNHLYPISAQSSLDTNRKKRFLFAASCLPTLKEWISIKLPTPLDLPYLHGKTPMLLLIKQPRVDSQSMSIQSHPLSSLQ